jgi:RimJ/RimL family protein N-acetyltransferase
VFNEIIYTRRLQLRRIRETDLPLIHMWSNSDTACGPYLTPARLTAKSLYEQYTANAFWSLRDKKFIIEKRDGLLPIGTIRYWLKPDQEKNAVMSVNIADIRERAKGFGTEAQKYLIMHLFEQIGVKTLEMYTDIDNLPQQRCLKKLGFSIARSLTYEDRQVSRTGCLFVLTAEAFQSTAIYRFHYE